MYTLLMKIACAVMLLAALQLQGCATVVNGLRQDVDITTTPPGVTATIKNESCTTPCILNASRSAQYVTLEKGAYREKYILDKKIDYLRTIVGNILWLPLGVIFDVAAGGAYEIGPVDITLSESELALSGSAPDEEPAREEAGEVRVPAVPVTPAPKKMFAWSVGVSGYRGGGRTEEVTQFRYENMLSPHVSVFAQLEFISHRSELTSFTDTASGNGGAIGILIYPRHAALQGWYLGGGLGFWSVKGDWQDDVGTPFVTTGHGEATVADIDLQTGYKWYPIGPHFFIDPSLGVAGLIGNGNPAQFGPGGGYFRAGLAAGVRF